MLSASNLFLCHFFRSFSLSWYSSSHEHCLRVRSPFCRHVFPYQHDLVIINNSPTQPTARLEARLVDSNPFALPDEKPQGFAGQSTVVPVLRFSTSYNALPAIVVSGTMRVFSPGFLSVSAAVAGRVASEEDSIHERRGRRLGQKAGQQLGKPVQLPHFDLVTC